MSCLVIPTTKPLPDGRTMLRASKDLPGPEDVVAVRNQDPA